MLLVKAGGRALLNVSERARDLAAYSPFVLVHGGGDQVTSYSLKMGVTPRIVISPSGVKSRYTDARELEVYIMVMAGKLNKEIVSKLLDRGVKAAGISGLDGPTLIAERKRKIVVVEKGRRRVVPGGYTGRIVAVDTSLIRALLSGGFSVVLAPVARGTQGEALNVDGDQAAYQLALALKPEKLVILSDVDGVEVDGSPMRGMSWLEAAELAKAVGPGMNRKLLMASKAAEAGVEVVIASGLKESPVTRALGGEGTRVKP
ncbi:MAG: acetylaminoadipate kinase [Thermoproteota archaeon]|nr:MAG: acetylaminoadipate kinase [Candidatus Korarchaeota archaeon]